MAHSDRPEEGSEKGSSWPADEPAGSGGDDEGGYCKPPVKSRWKKGQSGNPYGRPRKKDKQPFTGKVNPVRDIVTEELARAVSLKEGGLTLKMETLRAVTRSTCVGAIKGNRFHQKLAMEWARAAEESRKMDLETLVSNVMIYKDHFDPIFQRARTMGQPEPTQLPHPDHVNIDPMTAELVISGPQNRADKKAWDLLKFQLRGSDVMLAKQRLTAALNPRRRHEKKAIRMMEDHIAQLEARVPPGWDWHEELGWEQVYADRIYGKFRP